MIRRLIILLLIVGCAPTTKSEFYIGMPQAEFINQNPHCNKIDNKINGLIVYNEDVGIIPPGHYTSNKYIFTFKDDTLDAVFFRGLLHLSFNKEIDYDKYATSPE